MSVNMLTLGSLGLLGVLAVLALAARHLPIGSRFNPANRERSLSIRETLVLDPKRRLHLIDWSDGTVLLLTGGAQDIVVGKAKDK